MTRNSSKDVTHALGTSALRTSITSLGPRTREIDIESNSPPSKRSKRQSLYGPPSPETDSDEYVEEEL